MKTLIQNTNKNASDMKIAREQLASWTWAARYGHDTLEQDQVERQRDLWAAKVAALSVLK